jgi:hypothetical protein
MWCASAVVLTARTRLRHLLLLAARLHLTAAAGAELAGRWGVGPFGEGGVASFGSDGRARLGGAARERVRQNLQLDSVTAQYEALFRSVLQE